MRKPVMCLLLGLLAMGSQADQTCNENLEFRTPTSRYFDYGDGRMLDRVTGLVWQRCPLGFAFSNGGTVEDLDDDECTPDGTTMFTWQEALNDVADGNDAGGWHAETDWRIPNIHELASMTEFRCALPAVNLQVFPDTPSVAFWSSTHDLNTDSLAMAVDFQSGAIVNRGRTSAFSVRIVRGPIPVL